ncbi:hypothetical protein RSOLAG22IIIB_06116 [Rhizoctonia solani]|uniref:Uncharacterized protein n=1 Tax=Rhizoctonia solani TaxID=456999 RepID=A0A0K6GCF3_9AGAM|nr:hypothetical protein RSOLAG22IIIB_06116 [Rhizoctonia solani]
MFPDIPSQLLPYADEHEHLIRALIYLETEAGSSWYTESEAVDLLREADIAGRAYIQYVQKQSGYHDRFFTNMAKYLVALSENLSKRLHEDPLVTPALGETFTVDETRPSSGGALGVALIHAMENICMRIQELKVEEFVETKLENTALRARQKAAFTRMVNELYDKAFAQNATTLEDLEKYSNIVKEKRSLSINTSTESELDQMVWYCHRVELVLGDVRVMMDRHENDKKDEFWKTSILKWCQLASDCCEELKAEVTQYLDVFPNSLLPRSALKSLPTIDAKKLTGRLYLNLFIKYSNALTEFANVVVGAMKKAEARKLKAEVECLYAQNLLDLYERQLGTTRPTESSDPPSLIHLLESTRDYSLDDYVNFVVGLRFKQARRISILSEVWNLRLNWSRGREGFEKSEKKMDLDLLEPDIQKSLEELTSDGRDHARAPQTLGWWDLDE